MCPRYSTWGKKFTLKKMVYNSLVFRTSNMIPMLQMLYVGFGMK
jgi:hypothetical protein